MLKKVVTYTDYNGNTRTEDFYFNITKSEAIELEGSIDGGFSKALQQIVLSNDRAAMYRVIHKLILTAYGEKSDDGKYFKKLDIDGHRLSDQFAQTEAFEELIMELTTDADAASEFTNAVLPKVPEKLLKQTEN